MRSLLTPAMFVVASNSNSLPYRFTETGWIDRVQLNADVLRHATRIFLSCLFSFLLLATQVIAAPVSNRDLAIIHQQGDVAQMQELAEAGDVRAQHWLGLMLHNRSRYDEAIQWYARAVENGDAKSANRIAFFHEHGIGRPKDAREALTWHRKGAELGDFSSRVRYATALRDGTVLERDEKEAFDWFAKAAQQRGYQQRGYAFLPMAEMYESGSGVPRDLGHAYAYAKAAELTVDDSDVSSLRKARSLRDKVADQMSPAERAFGDRLFQTLVPGAPELSDPRSGAWILGGLFAALFGAGIILFIRRRRRLRRNSLAEDKPRFPLAWCAIASLAGSVALALVLRAFLGEWALGFATIGFVLAFMTFVFGGRALAERFVSEGKDSFARGAAIGALAGILVSWLVAFVFAALLLGNGQFVARPESLLVGLVGTPLGVVHGAVTGVVLIWLGRKNRPTEA